MDAPNHGSDESRAAEVVDGSPASGLDPPLGNLPGTTVGDVDEVHLQAQKIHNLRAMRSTQSSLRAMIPAQKTATATVNRPRVASKWNKARTVVGAQSKLTAQMLELRGLVGTAGGSATIEETEELLRKEQLMQRGEWYIIMPDSSFKMGWDLLQVVVLLYVAAIVPLRIGFDTRSSPFSTIWWVEVFVDLYFLVDVRHRKPPSPPALHFAVLWLLFSPPGGLHLACLTACLAVFADWSEFRDGF